MRVRQHTRPVVVPCAHEPTERRSREYVRTPSLTFLSAQKDEKGALADRSLAADEVRARRQSDPICSATLERRSLRC